MREPRVVVFLTPPSFALRFEDLGDSFPYILSGLKDACPWMRWDKVVRVWRGPVGEFSRTLRYCHNIFDDHQVLIIWSEPSTQEPPRQLRLL
jgi:hypothetical protein